MATNAVAHEAVCALRREIARIEGRLPDQFEPPVASTSTGDGLLLRHGGLPVGQHVLPTGAARLDAALQGGLPLAALTEIHGRQTRDAGAVAGFTLALCAAVLKTAPVKAPLLWVATDEAL